MGKLYGRRFDLTFTTDGTPIYPLAYGRILQNYPCIGQWQFVQSDEKQYNLRLVLRENDQKALLDMKSNIQAILGKDAQIEINLVDDKIVLTSGKRKPVVNEWIKNK